MRYVVRPCLLRPTTHEHMRTQHAYTQHLLGDRYDQLGTTPNEQRVLGGHAIEDPVMPANLFISQERQQRMIKECIAKGLLVDGPTVGAHRAESVLEM